MTVNIAFLCTDGVVLAADSMLTTSDLSYPAGIGKHSCRKLHVIGGNKLFAWSGDQGHADRFRMHLEKVERPLEACHPLTFPLAISEAALIGFEKTMIVNSIDCESFVAFSDGQTNQCCAFTGSFQPVLLNEQNYFMALGAGKQLADPFLKYITDILCTRQPSVREACFLAYWTILHVIEAGPGGVDHPIRIGKLTNESRAVVATELEHAAIAEHEQMIEGLKSSMRDWRKQINAESPSDAASPPRGPKRAQRS